MLRERLGDLLYRFRAIFRRAEMERDLEDELRFHLEREAEKYVRAGLSHEEATRRARLVFGGLEGTKEASRDTRGTRWMEDIFRDVRYAARTLRRSPVFTIAAVITLALGIGANSAIFSVANGVLFRSLPFAEPDALVMLGTTSRTEGPLGISNLSAPNFMTIREDAPAFEDVVAFSRRPGTLTGRGDPAPVEVGQVSAGFFRLLGAEPALGRSFRAEENQPGNTDAVVLSHRLWQSLFGGDSGVVGEAVTLDGTALTVVGVAPPDVDVLGELDVWVPMPYGETFNSTTVANRGANTISVFARLKPGITVDLAQRELDAIALRLEAEFPSTNSNVTFDVRPLRELILGDVKAPLLILLGAVGFVLLIACTNVANLLLVRSAGRQREMAVRAAIGAGRFRLVRQVLGESALLGLIGGAAGLAVAYAAVRGLVLLRPEGIPRIDEISIDGTVVLFTIATSLLTGLLFGCFPARRVLLDLETSTTLREGARGSSGGRSAARLRSVLVVAQMALAVTLLVGAGLLMRSFAELQRVDPGFRSEGAVAFNLALPSAAYPEPPRIAEFYRSLVDRMAAVPGVTAAAAVNVAPLSGSTSNATFQIAGREPWPRGEGPVLHIRVMTPDYFRTMGIPLLRGRPLGTDDHMDAPQVAVLNEAAAREFFPGEDPIGQTIRMDYCGGERCAGGEVVGVVGDVRHSGLAADYVPEIYLPHAQWRLANMTAVARTSSEPMQVMDSMRRIVGDMDPNLALSDVRGLEQVLDAAVAQPRFYALLLGLFAGIALLLATVGIFGVLSFTVAQQKRDIGIRIALGADSRGVRVLVVRRALLLAGAGIIVGLSGALALSRVLDSLLYGIAATDVPTYLATVIVLTGAALLASYIPARAATQVDPAITMRND